jgi:hypothetical protein
MTPLSTKLPRRVVVEEVISSRYPPGERPTSWDKRHQGTEKIRTTEGEELLIYSNGGQSSPAKGWEILLTKEGNEDCSPVDGQPISWTLYGLKR